MNHGANSTYQGGCRCPECTAAHTVYERNRRERVRLGIPRRRYLDQGEIQHGTTHSYNYHRCRCFRCALARSVYMREYRARRKAAS